MSTQTQALHTVLDLSYAVTFILLYIYQYETALGIVLCVLNTATILSIFNMFRDSVSAGRVVTTSVLAVSLSVAASFGRLG